MTTFFSCRCTLKIEQNKEIYLALNEGQSSNRISGLLKFPESTLRPALSKRGRPYLICKKTERAMLELENSFKYMELMRFWSIHQEFWILAKGNVLCDLSPSCSKFSFLCCTTCRVTKDKTFHSTAFTSTTRTNNRKSCTGHTF